MLKKYIFIIQLMLLSGFANAYSPNLVLLGEYKAGKYFIDMNSIKNTTLKSMNKNRTKLKQAVIYEKFSSPVRLDRDEPYKSSIKYIVVNCKSKEISPYRGDYYKGLTSNTEWLGAYNNAVSRNENETYYFVDNLEFYSLSELKKYGIQNSSLPYFYDKAMSIVCS